MQCPKCGADVEQSEQFCRKCGNSLKGVTDSTMVTDGVPPGDTTHGESESGSAAVAATAAAVGDDTAEIDAPDEPAPTPPPPPPVGAPLPPPSGAPGDQLAATMADEPPLIRPATDSDAVDLEELAFPAGAEKTTQMSAQTGVRGEPAIDPTITTPLTIVPATDLYASTTDEFPAVFDGGDDHYVGRPPREKFKIRVVFLVGIFAVAVTAMVATADVIDIFTSIPVDGIAQGTLLIDDFGTNLAAAGYVGGGAMVVGGLFACFGFRWGAGLAGGAGLALAGWATLVLGLAEVPIETATAITRNPTTGAPFTLTVTRDIGYWLIVAAGGLGLIGFLFSLNQSGRGGRRSLNPWIAALAAVAVLVFATGPMIPVAGATFADNFGQTEIFRIPGNDADSVVPLIYFIGRLTQVGLIALAGVVGFLMVRTWGIGLAAGSISVGLWMWITSLGELGDTPIGLAVANLFAPDSVPHAVTSVGAGLTFFLLLVAAIIAASQPTRPRR